MPSLLMFATIAAIAANSPAPSDTVTRPDTPGSGESLVVPSAGAPELPPVIDRRLVPSDTAARRRRAVTYSEAYGTRLVVHRYASYAMLPVFATQYVLGDRLLQQKQDVFAGARTVPVDAGLRRTHAAVAIGLASIFAVNTVTGVWNLYEARDDPARRGLRTTHALTMLAADAGFVAVGVLGGRARDGNPADARQHRGVALGSMAVATAGAALMWVANRE